MEVHVGKVRELQFDDGSPVSAASGIAPFGGGWLVVQDDATSAAWCRGDRVTRVRLLPPIDGRDRFTEAEGTKHLKPDLEVACPVEVDGSAAVLVLGSGSSSRRMRGVLVRLGDDGPSATAADLTALYGRVAGTLDLPLEHLNLEGASRHAGTLRWFNRGNLAAGVPSAGVAVPVERLVAAVLGRSRDADVPVTEPHVYDLGAVDGVGLAITDAVALPDGRTLLSAAAEDTPNAVDDGPVVATALALLDGERVLSVARVPDLGGRVHKIEGLALGEVREDEVHLLAVVDDDDPARPSAAMHLRAVLHRPRPA